MEEHLLSLGLRLVKKLSLRKYHRDHKVQALKILKAIESRRGITDPKLLATCDEYAGDVLGWRGYAPWLYVYTAESGCFKPGWIPDDY